MNGYVYVFPDVSRHSIGRHSFDSSSVSGFARRRPASRLGRSRIVGKDSFYRRLKHRSSARPAAPRRKTSLRSRFGRLFQEPAGRSPERHGAIGKSPLPGYEVVKKLSPGGMSEAVTLVKKNGKLFITKRVRADGYRMKLTMAELKVLQSLSREKPNNLNYLVDHQWGPQNLHITFVLEYCDGGSLSDKIEQYQKNGGNALTAFAWHCLLGISNALAFLHHGIRDPLRDHKDSSWNSTFHLDLKPCNVFFSAKDQRGPYPRVVVGDFGCAITARDIRDGLADPRHQRWGTPVWYPPEGLSGVVGPSHTRYGCETDVWQMGATIHALCRRLDSHSRRHLDSDSPCGGQYGATLNSTINQCTKNWKKRWTAAEVARKVHEVVRRKKLRI